jgi:putative PIN family toxin of toxin-antitoxin system
MKVVIDTNVLVSGLLTRDGTCGQVIQLAYQKLISWQIDRRILDEYQEVLMRPKFCMVPEDLFEAIDMIVACAEFVTALPLHVTLPDNSDLPFLEVAHASEAALVTGNTRHFAKRLCKGVPILTSRQFLESIAQE